MTTSKRVAQKQRKREEAKIAAEKPAKVLPKSATAVIASSRVKVYSIEVLEALKYCTGGHGLKTFTLVQEKVTMQAEWRKTQYMKVRKYQRQVEKLQASQVMHVTIF